MKFVDMEGQKFYRLTIVRQADKDAHGRVCWLCLCDCGRQIVVPIYRLKNDNTKSCGCFKTDNLVRRNTKHGYRTRDETTKEYMVWKAMKGRCANPKSKDYPNYGGRSIRVCDRWRNSFINFLEDMGECPLGYSLDRVNNNKGYSENNCRWATREEQANNKRNNHWITFGDKTQTMIQWAKELGIKYRTLRNRINTLKWSVEKSLTKPVTKNGR